MKWFDRNILKIIKKFEHEFFIVQQDFDIDCVCVNYDTKQADPGCKKCLGTGHKIKIRKIRGASQDSTIPNTARPVNELFVAKSYYIKTECKMYKDNIIVDNDEIYFVYQPRNATAFEGRTVYQKVMAISKKLDSKVFLKNFYEIIGR